MDIGNGVYQVGTVVGIIKIWCSSEELLLVSNNGLEDCRVPKVKFVIVREAIVV